MTSSSEDSFLSRVEEDVKAFLEVGDDDNHDRVLVFKAFNSRLRYLVHQRVVDAFPYLVTKSVGRDPDRFVCVCFADRCGNNENRVRDKSEAALSDDYDHGYHYGRSFCWKTAGSNSSSRCASPASRAVMGDPSPCSLGRRPRRPDREMYVPKPRLADLRLRCPSPRDRRPPPPVPRAISPTGCDLASDLGNLSLSEDGATNAAAADNSDEKSASRVNEDAVRDVARRYLNGEIYCGDDMLRLSGPPSSRNSPVASPLVEPSDGDDEDHDVSPAVLDELRAVLGPGGLELCPAQGDYAEFETGGVPVCFRPGEYDFVLELYDFPPAFRERDLFRAFGKHRDAGGFEVKWVGDTSALGIFSSVAAAEEALREGSAVCKMRLLSEGSKEAVMKARRVQCSLMPALKRPETNSSHARRMIGHALGQRISVPKEKQEAEKRQLLDAREQRRESRTRTRTRKSQESDSYS